MENGNYFCYNSKTLKTGKLILSADNRSFRYGDGFFETIKMVNGNITLKNYHFERLFSSLQILKFKSPTYFTAEYLSEQIKTISIKNNHSKLARIRVTIFGGETALYEEDERLPNYIIQSWQLNPEVLKLNENGLITGIYKDARKACDAFSHIKSNNYLPYTMAAIWAKENKLNDAFLLNNYNRIADATIANIFIVKNKIVQTPALSEGCIGGVVRRYLIEQMHTHSIEYEETAITIEQVLAADEVFLTNSGWYLQWVKQCGVAVYTNRTSGFLYEKFIVPIVKK